MDPRTARWEALAPRWDAMLADAASDLNREDAFRRFHWFLKRRVRIGNRTKSYRLLDLGCGTGEASWPLWKRVASVTFFDRSPAMLRLARNKWPRGVFVRGEAASLPFLDAEFDVVLSRGALVSQLDPLEIKPFFQHVWRILRPQGLFLFDFIANREAWPDADALYPSAWTRLEMERLLSTELPTATVLAWDGSERHGFNRVLLRK
jgi:ubiquinone/menaquinone biosynthesis C-methylase UbiE